MGAIRSIAQLAVAPTDKCGAVVSQIVLPGQVRRPSYRQGRQARCQDRQFHLGVSLGALGGSRPSVAIKLRHHHGGARARPVGDGPISAPTGRNGPLSLRPVTSQTDTASVIAAPTRVRGGAVSVDPRRAMRWWCWADVSDPRQRRGGSPRACCSRACCQPRRPAPPASRWRAAATGSTSRPATAPVPTPAAPAPCAPRSWKPTRCRAPTPSPSPRPVRSRWAARCRRWRMTCPSPARAPAS